MDFQPYSVLLWGTEISTHTEGVSADDVCCAVQVVSLGVAPGCFSSPAAYSHASTQVYHAYFSSGRRG